MIKKTNKDEINTKYKTEICKDYNLTGKCNFGKSCAFAHGREELRKINNGPNYKEFACWNFNNGYCSYGTRCMFYHFKNNRLKIFKLITSTSL